MRNFFQLDLFLIPVLGIRIFSCARGMRFFDEVMIRHSVSREAIQVVNFIYQHREGCNSSQMMACLCTA
jgi:hypothetical protein